MTKYWDHAGVGAVMAYPPCPPPFSSSREQLDGQQEFEFPIRCNNCAAHDGAHAYWCQYRKRYAKDREQGA